MKRPDLYVKGEEYAKPEDDITGKIQEEIELVRKHGGDIAYTAGQVFISTRLINHALPALTDEVREFAAGFSQHYSMVDIRSLAERMNDLKVLVIGDTILEKEIADRWKTL